MNQLVSRGDTIRALGTCHKWLQIGKDTIPNTVNIPEMRKQRMHGIVSERKVYNGG